MNRNFTPCNDAPEALTGNAAARFGIALSKAYNSLSISELRGGGGVNPLFAANYACSKTFFHFPHTKAVSNSGWVRLSRLRAFNRCGFLFTSRSIAYFGGKYANLPFQTT